MGSMTRRRLILVLLLSSFLRDVPAAEIPVRVQYPSAETLQDHLKEIGGSSIFLALVEKYSERENLVLYMASPWEGTLAKTAYVFVQILKPSGPAFVIDKGVMDRTPDHTSLHKFRYDPNTGVVRYFDDYDTLLAEKPVTLH